MPIFEDKVFIHIPKTGGYSVVRLLEENEVPISVFDDTGKNLINHRSPQHCTYAELIELGHILPDSKVFTIVRHPYERALSEYFYLKQYDINKNTACYNNIDEFLHHFLNPGYASVFDNHNMSNLYFLKNRDGAIGENITVFKYGDIACIEQFIGYHGLDDINLLKTVKTESLTDEHKEKIYQRYIEDFEAFGYDH